MSTAIEIFSPSDRERFLDALVGLCAERRPGEITLEMLVERSGLSEARFAELFGDGAGVEDCMLAAGTMVTGDLIEAISATYAADRFEWDSGIRRTLAMLELLAANPSRAHFICITARSAGGRVSEAQQATRHLLAAMVDSLRDSAPDCRAPVRAALGAVGGVEALIRREVAAGRAEDLPRLLPAIVYATSVPYLGPEVATSLAGRAKRLLRKTAWE